MNSKNSSDGEVSVELGKTLFRIASDVVSTQRIFDAYNLENEDLRAVLPELTPVLSVSEVEVESTLSFRVFHSEKPHVGVRLLDTMSAQLSPNARDRCSKVSILIERIPVNRKRAKKEERNGT